MPDKKQIPLAQMRPGQSGTVIEIQGSHGHHGHHGHFGLVNRLDALGIRPGKRVVKVSSMFMHGPVTVQINGTQVAIGFGMSKRIIVEPD